MSLISCFGVISLVFVIARILFDLSISYINAVVKLETRVLIQDAISCDFVSFKLFNLKIVLFLIFWREFFVWNGLGSKQALKIF